MARLVDDRILSCGHAPSPDSDGTSGTARTRDGREICWECADTEQRAAMADASRFAGYLSGDGTAITTWSGGVLARVTRSVTRRVGFGRSSRVYFDAIDPTGKRWFGQSTGMGMFATMRAAKGRK